MKGFKRYRIMGVLAALLLAGCSGGGGPTQTVFSPSGYVITLAAFPDTIRNDGKSQATLKAEVRDLSGNFVNGVVVAFTTTLGTLGATSVTTVNGVALTTLTAGTTVGTAHVTATVENQSVTYLVAIVKF